MKNIFKYLLIALVGTFIITSCDNEADRDWSSQEPTFKLHDTTLGNNVLYASMEENPFILTWDKAPNATGEYSIVVSDTENFAKKIELGKSASNTLKTKIGSLNMAILKLGLNPYIMQKIYIRVENASSVSNSISFNATPYPADAPIIITPTTGTSFELNQNDPEGMLTTVTWKDYDNYGVSVTYTVEIAKKGTTNFEFAGSATNSKYLDWTHKALNDAVLKTGALPNVVSEIDVRVLAKSETTAGIITKTSEVVTIKVKPYVAFKNLFFVGDATRSNWNNNNDNQVLFRDPSNTNKFYFTGYFNAGAFKLLEILGQWQPQWGLKGGVVANSDGGEPDVFSVPSAGYYSFEIDILAKTYSLTPYSGSMTDYNAVGIVGSATPNTWNGPDVVMMKSSFDTHQWQVLSTNLTNAEMKFRNNNDWGTNWGANTPISGQAVLGNSGNIPVQESAAYDVYFNDLDGRYQMIKK
jgi:hypothetical protein